jgi:hypothetical protein
MQLVRAKLTSEDSKEYSTQACRIKFLGVTSIFLMLIKFCLDNIRRWMINYH